MWFKRDMTAVSCRSREYLETCLLAPTGALVVSVVIVVLRCFFFKVYCSTAIRSNFACFKDLT